MTDIDTQLREAFARIAEPGDPAGVVDTIRTRVDAGETGTSAGSSGFGGGSWLPWAGLVVVAGLVGTGVGITGTAGAPAAEVVQLTVLAVDATTNAYDCPSGTAVSQFSANERALVVARSEDSAWLGVRDSYDYSRTVWLPASVVSVDPGQGDVESVAVQDCAVPDVVVNVPAPVVTEAAPPPKPAPVATDAKPQITGITQTQTTIHQTGALPDRSVVAIAATDDKSVSSVLATWPASPGITAGSVNAVFAGGTWNFTFGPFPNPSGYGSNTTITVVATDSAGQQSAPRTLSVTMTYVMF
jgi:hypothetical protein